MVLRDFSLLQRESSNTKTPTSMKYLFIAVFSVQRGSFLSFFFLKIFLFRIIFLFSMCSVANFKTQDDQYATDE